MHIDTGAVGLNGYDLVQSISQIDTGVVIALTSSAARRAGIAEEIVIAVNETRLDEVSLSEALRPFQDRLR